MINDFFRINLPYGIIRNNKNEWAAINRAHLPVNMNNKELHEQPGENYLAKAVYIKYIGITEEFLKDLAYDEFNIRRNKLGQIDEVYLYNDLDFEKLDENEKYEFLSKYFVKLRMLLGLKKVIS
ncbi:MAG: hypothetical protein ACOYOV_11260 [Bacteroidales bacterium]